MGYLMGRCIEGFWCYCWTKIRKYMLAYKRKMKDKKLQNMLDNWKKEADEFDRLKKEAEVEI